MRPFGLSPEVTHDNRDRRIAQATQTRKKALLPIRSVSSPARAPDYYIHLSFKAINRSLALHGNVH
ncbi:protein of unknown function [Pararobbsia alpina]